MELHLRVSLSLCGLLKLRSLLKLYSHLRVDLGLCLCLEVLELLNLDLSSDLGRSLWLEGGGALDMEMRLGRPHGGHHRRHW